MKFIIKRRSLLFLICLFFVGNTVYSQTPVKGFFLVAADSKIPVTEAVAQSKNLQFSAVADESGFVSLKNLPSGIRILSVSCVGYETLSIAIDSVLIVNDKALVYLYPKVSSLAEIRLVAGRKGGVFKTISDLDIHLRPINNSQEVLRMVPGLFIGQHAGGGKSEQIFLRGFDLDHGTDINLTVDGMPVNMVSHAHGQGYADLHFVIPELIEKLNFNKGPYAADKGNFTTAGYVEFKTKNYLDKSFVKVEGGQFSTARVIAGINLLEPAKDRRNQSLFIAGEGSYTKGFFESAQDFNRFNGLLKYHSSIGPRTSITASATAFTSKWNASGQIPDRAVKDGSIGFYGAIDNTEGGNTSRYNANLELRTRMQDGAILTNQIFYTKNKFELYSNFTFFKEDSINGDQIRQKEDRNLLGYNGSYKKEFFIGKVQTETNAGVQLRYDDVNDVELSRTVNRSTVTEAKMLGDVNEMNLGAYLSQKFMVAKKLDITAGLRADYFTNKYDDKLSGDVLKSTSTIISPKLNFDLRVSKNVQLYFYNGKGFHSNDTRVAVQQNGRKVLPPGYGSDIGGIFKVGDKLVLQSALWYLWLDQEFIYVGDEGVVEPGGQTRRVGADFSARYEVIKNLFADIDLSFADPKALNVPNEESYLPLAPRFTSVGGFTYRKQFGLNGSIRYRYMADRPANENNSVIAKGYFVTDAAINYTQKKWEAGISIQNVFNVRWKETQFDTESRLRNETTSVSEIHFTPGTPFFARAAISIFF